jgi:hypothetical protein
MRLFALVEAASVALNAADLAHLSPPSDGGGAALDE